MEKTDQTTGKATTPAATPTTPATTSEPTGQEPTTPPVADPIETGIQSLTDALIQGVSATIPKTPEPVPSSEPAQTPVSPIVDYEKALESPEAFQQVLTNARKEIKTELMQDFKTQLAEAKQEILLNTQSHVSKTVKNEAYLQSAVRNFYTDNPNFASENNRIIVSAVASRIQSENPTLPIDQVLTRTKEIIVQTTKTGQTTNAGAGLPTDSFSRPTINPSGDDSGLTPEQKLMQQTYKR